MKRIGLAHCSIRTGDAVGNDLLGQYRTLEAMGFEPVLVGEYLIGEDITGLRHATLDDPRKLAEVDAVVYHHSFVWPNGGAALAAFGGPVAFKYHNVTPPEFFEGFAPHYVKSCGEGRAQTAALAALKPDAVWTADSPFNRQELLAAGVAPERAVVVPPFSRVDSLLVRAPVQRDPLHWLFAGRWAPNKGHRELVECFAMYRRHYSPGARLTVVGAVDESMGSYNVAVWNRVAAHGIESAVDFREHVSDEELDRLFATAGVYVHLSRHEGFCVPVIEAQAVGLPVIASNGGALPDTAGPGQAVLPEPCDDEDYQFIARVAHELAHNASLRASATAQGRLNVARRFGTETVANAFVGALEPLLRSLAP